MQFVKNRENLDKSANQLLMLNLEMSKCSKFVTELFFIVNVFIISLIPYAFALNISS